uniref:Fatty acid 2-hydroxylase n=1 Tax=Phallusia mammillata TaxID=59560 RepID=A0A6F9DD56_9ASCI|nr:fatty acid 2-hydroxylase [Phallusia mammillata]
MPQMNKDDIAQISSKDQTLVIHCGKVYDVTKFVNVHPGGSKILSLRHGKDVTKIMENGPHTHSKNAYRWLRQYYIADYCDTSESSDNHVTSNGTNGHIPSKSNGIKHVQQNGIANTQEEEIVNWDEPMLWQVGHLGAKYHSWIDDPVDKTLRLFKSDFVEYFSNTPWYVIPIVWLPVIVLFLLRSFSMFSDSNVALSNLVSVASFSLSASAMPVIFVLGMLLWSFLEYSLHRWLFHSDPPTTSYFLITLHFLLHGQHHKVPFDSGRLVFPPVASSVFLVILYPMFRLVFSAAVTDSLVAGVLFGYVCYDMTHYYLHYGAPRKGSYFDRLRAYHVRHHFESPHLGFGISSKLWDYPFNTLIRMAKKRSSE